MYYIALESDCFKASACAGAASFSLLELELEPERHPYVENFRISGSSSIRNF
jgi:hypothetical protein